MNIGVSALSKLISGEEPCLFKHWYTLHNKEKDKHDLDKKWISWRMKHNKIVTEVATQLQKEEGILKMEEWVEEVLSKEDKILGKVDLLHDLGKKVKIYEMKGGSYKSHSHVMQILIYLYMLDKLDIYKEKEISGILKYEDAEQEYNLNDVPNELPELISENAEILLSKNTPAKIMGGGCRFCEVPCELKE